MAKGDVNYIIKRLNKMAEKSSSLKSKNFHCALDKLPASGQIKELKEVVARLDAVHKSVLKLATIRGPRIKKDLAMQRKYKELNRMLEKADLSSIFAEAAERAQSEIEAYRRARAKSKGEAASTVFF